MNEIPEVSLFVDLTASNGVGKSRLSFNNFVGFINMDGLDEDVGIRFEPLLRELFQDSWERLWKPGACCGAVEIARKMREISPRCFRGEWKTGVWWNRTEHMWTTIRGGLNNREVVIDPAGVYEPSFGAILPYFGLPERASYLGYPMTNARRVYQEGEELTLAQEENILPHLRILLSGV